MTWAWGAVWTWSQSSFCRIQICQLISSPLGCRDGLQAWSLRVPEAGMDQRNVNLPSPASLGRLGGFQPSFFRPPRLQRWGFYNFLPINNTQLWRCLNHRFLLHLPVFLWACGFWATGPSDAILHVSRALCLSLPLHGACPPRPHGKLACLGTEKQVTVLQSKLVRPLGPELRGLDAQFLLFPVHLIS